MGKTDAPGYLPEGYKKSKKTWRVDGPAESDNWQTEHWDGRLDAEIRPAPVTMKTRAHRGEE